MVKLSLGPKTQEIMLFLYPDKHVPVAELEPLTSRWRSAVNSRGSYGMFIVTTTKGVKIKLSARGKRYAAMLVMRAEANALIKENTALRKAQRSG